MTSTPQPAENSDRQKRVEYYHRAQQIIAENLPVIYLALPENLIAIHNTLGNLTPTPYGIWDIRYLYVKDP